MGNKTIFNKIMYFLGIEDEDPNPEIEDDYFEQKTKGRVINIHQASKNKMVIYKPTSFDEVKEMSDEVRNRRAVIVNLEKTEKECAQRILDFMSGSVYALSGVVQKIGPGIYIFAPDNVDISGVEIEEEVKESGYSI